MLSPVLRVLPPVILAPPPAILHSATRNARQPYRLEVTWALELLAVERVITYSTNEEVAFPYCM